jgi:AraC family transcriptional regulator of adaptative response/methylated-DNA-[protein]-cysteine methyltransferase
MMSMNRSALAGKAGLENVAMNDYRDDAARWRAVRQRDARADGRFWYSVMTTGVFCYPSCAARTPHRENVAFYDSVAAAHRAGFRPCKRCRPELPPRHARLAEAVAQACRMLEAAEQAPGAAELAATLGLPARALQREFKQLVGVTLKQYAAGMRAERMRAELASAGSVTTAVYAAGYGSPSRFYEHSERLLGMRPRSYARGGRGQAIRWDVGRSWLGPVLVAATERGICAVLLGASREALAALLEQRFPQAELEPADSDSDFARWIKAVIAEIDAPSGDATLPLDISGTAFQQRVWQALRDIPPGETTSYGQLARQLGRPGAARAVGTACGANPVAVIIPCHRVLGADGSLGGYRWGTERKRALLEREAAGRQGERD